MKKFVLALILALTGFVAVPSAAQANEYFTTPLMLGNVVEKAGNPVLFRNDVCPSCNGGWVHNRSDSSHNILIFNGSSNAILYPGQSSDRFTYWQDVDQLNSPHCNAQRYENGLWTTVYKAGVWYAVGDSQNIVLRVAWC